MLKESDFYFIIKNSPIVAIDFVVQNKKNKKILLGFRNNEPAKGEYFTFGSILKKNESIFDAQNRVLKSELGIENFSNKIKFIGIHEHNYHNNFKDNKTRTHYVVISYLIRINEKKIKHIQHNKNPYLNQHSDLKWFKIKKILKSQKFHKNVKLILKNL